MTPSWAVLGAWGCLVACASLLLRKPRVTLNVFVAALGPPLLACLDTSNFLAGVVRFEHPVLTGTGVAIVLLWQHSSSHIARSRPSAVAMFSVCVACGSLAAGGLTLRMADSALDVAVAIDRSRSAELTPSLARRLELEWELVKRAMGPEHRVAVIDFGARAHLTSSPQRKQQLRIQPPPASLQLSATDLESAIRTGLAVLPSDGSGRLVLVTDGRATRGSVESGLRAARRQNVAVDVVPLERPDAPNLRIDRLNGPLVVRTGEAFDLRVVFESPEPMEVGFELLANGETVDRGHLSLRGGQDVVRFGLRAGESNLTRYAVRCWATLRSQDQIQDDNEGAIFVQVLGRSNALVVSPAENPSIAQVLGHGDFAVTTTTPERAPQTAAEWALHDLIVVEGFPSERFFPEQLSSLATAVEHLGTGLLLLGSSDGLGPGGYGFTALERISPVSFDVAHERRRGRVNLALLVDASASMAVRVGVQTKLVLAHHAVLDSASTLEQDDRLAVAHVNQNLAWTVPLGAGLSTADLTSALEAVEPLGSGIRADVALRQTYPKLQASDAHVKHVVLLADADDIEGASQATELARAAAVAGVTTSVISLGTGRDASATRRIATAGRGRHFAVTAPEQLSSVLVRETLAASHNPVREVVIRVAAESTAVTQGIEFAAAPALGGYVTTLAKPRATLHLRSPDSAPILASWSIGLGQMAVFTSDYGWRWGTTWTQWAGGAQLMMQTARLVSRPTAASGVLARAVPREGRLQLSVDVLGGDPQPRSFSARVVTPSGSVVDTALLDRGAGRFGSELPLGASGTYLVSISDQRSGKVRARTGVEVGLNDELAREGPNLVTLRHLAERGNGVLLAHISETFTVPSANVYTYRSLSVLLLWLTATFMVVGLGVTQWQAARPGAGRPHTDSTPPARILAYDPRGLGGPQVMPPGASTAEQLLARRKRAGQRQSGGGPA